MQRIIHTTPHNIESSASLFRHDKENYLSSPSKIWHMTMEGLISHSSTRHTRTTKILELGEESERAQGRIHNSMEHPSSELAVDEIIKKLHVMIFLRSQATTMGMMKRKVALGTVWYWVRRREMMKNFQRIFSRFSFFFIDFPCNFWAASSPPWKHAESIFPSV